MSLDETIDLDGVTIRHQKTSFFDAKAWQARCRGPFATPEEAAAIDALDTYKRIEDAARQTESFAKSGGVRVTIKEDL